MVFTQDSVLFEGCPVNHETKGDAFYISVSLRRYYPDQVWGVCSQAGIYAPPPTELFICH